MPSYFPERLYQFMFLTTVTEHCSFNWLWSGLGLGIKSITFLQHFRGFYSHTSVLHSWLLVFVVTFTLIRGVSNQVLLIQNNRGFPGFLIDWLKERIEFKALTERDSRIKMRYWISYRSELKMGLLLNWMKFHVSLLFCPWAFLFYWTKYTRESPSEWFVYLWRQELDLQSLWPVSWLSVPLQVLLDCLS